MPTECKTAKCERRAIYGAGGDASRIACSDHKLSGMFNYDLICQQHGPKKCGKKKRYGRDGVLLACPGCAKGTDMVCLVAERDNAGNIIHHAGEQAGASDARGSGGGSSRGGGSKRKQVGNKRTRKQDKRRRLHQQPVIQQKAQLQPEQHEKHEDLESDEDERDEDDLDEDEENVEVIKLPRVPRPDWLLSGKFKHADQFRH